MTLVEKFQSILILAAVFAGIALGSVPVIAQNAGHFILPLLMVMLTGVFLHIPVHRFRDVFQYRGVAGASLVINFVWIPLLAWVLEWLFLDSHPALWVGFLMLMVTPCTDWYLVFTGIAKGNLALSTALLPVNLVLQLAPKPPAGFNPRIIFSGTGFSYRLIHKMRHHHSAHSQTPSSEGPVPYGRTGYQRCSR